MVDGVGPAVRVGHCAEHVVQALGGLRLRQGVRAQENLHLPVGRVLQAVRRAQHPLLGHQDAAAEVLAVHLHRRHVGPRVGLGLSAAQDPTAGLRRTGGDS